MVHAQLHGVLRHLHSLGEMQALAKASDAQLLERFAARHEESAFTALLKRHGPMVLGVSRRVLPTVQDAEDVFQATFLLLAQKATSILKHGSVGSWLHGVAHRLALKMRLQQARRVGREKRAAEGRTMKPDGDSSWPEVQAALDTALDALPEKYRAALVLCYLEGKSHAEAAEQLGCPLTTLSTHVARGRKLLRERLTKQGLTLSTAGLVSLLLACAAPAAAPAALTKATVKAALAFAAGQQAAALCPTQVAGLVEGGLKAMFLGKAKVATTILVVGIVAAACGLAHSSASSQDRRSRQEPASAKRQAVKDAADDNDTVVCSGRVIDPDGKPVAEAKVHFVRLGAMEATRPSARGGPTATTDTEGRFQFQVAGAEFHNEKEKRSWFNATITAVHAGWGPGWVTVTKTEALKDVTVKLVKDDVPVQGRVVNLEGKPIAGVTVRIKRVAASESENLKLWVADLQNRKEVFSIHSPRTILHPDDGA